MHLSDGEQYQFQLYDLDSFIVPTEPAYETPLETACTLWLLSGEVDCDYIISC